MKYKVGDVILFKSNGNFIEDAICYVTRSEYCHVGIVSEVHQYHIVVAEALTSGFTKRNHGIKALSEKPDKFTVLRSKKKLTDINKHIDKYLGTTYGFIQLVAILLYRYTGYNVYDNGTKELICSEAVARVLYDSSQQLLNFEEEFLKPYDYITPADIAVSKQLKQVSLYK